MCVYGIVILEEVRGGAAICVHSIFYTVNFFIIIFNYSPVNERTSCVRVLHHFYIQNDIIGRGSVQYHKRY